MKLRKMIQVKIRIPGNKRKFGKPLVQVILDYCKKEEIIGLLVSRAVLGYGEHEYRSHILGGLTDLPLIIEIVDSPQIISKILPQLKEIVENEGLITVEEIMAI